MYVVQPTLPLSGFFIGFSSKFISSPIEVGFSVLAVAFSSHKTYAPATTFWLHKTLLKQDQQLNTFESTRGALWLRLYPLNLI